MMRTAPTKDTPRALVFDADGVVIEQWGFARSAGWNAHVYESVESIQIDP